MSAVQVNSAEVQFDGDDQTIALQSTSTNRSTWLTAITTEGFFDNVDPHDPISFKLMTTIPDDPDWIGRTGRMRWNVTVIYLRVTKKDSNKFEEKSRELKLDCAIKFLGKSKKKDG